MNGSESENVCSVKKSNDSGYYRIHTFWKNIGFHLNIISKNGAWRGEMSENEMHDMASQLNMDDVTYAKHCKEALTTHDGLKGILYAVEDGCFTWKKIIDEDSGIKLKMGSVKLEPTCYSDAVQNMLQAALEYNKKLLKQVNELQQKRENDITEKKMLLNKMEEIIKAKDDMETDLYTRFLLLLNSKKKKIEELEEKYNSLEESTSHSMRNSNKNLYEVSTDDDSSNEQAVHEWNKSEELSQTVKESITEDKKIFEDKLSLQPEIPQKKVKKIESTTVTKFYEENHLLEEPETSNFESEIQQSSKASEKSIPSKKEDILEFFYGS